MKDQTLESENQKPEKPERGIKKTKTIEEDQHRVVISKEANTALESMVSRANDGFEGGEVTKSDLANFIFINFVKSFSDSDIKTLRNLHFDEMKVLKSLLRKAGDDGALPDHLKRALREHYGLESKDRKATRKNSQEDAKGIGLFAESRSYDKASI
jgi:hypothetical protein